MQVLSLLTLNLLLWATSRISFVGNNPFVLVEHVSTIDGGSECVIPSLENTVRTKMVQRSHHDHALNLPVAPKE
jgi:hypothetical protein